MRPATMIKCLIVLWVCLEVASIVWVGNLIGLGWTLLLLILMMVLGSLLLRYEGFRVLNLMINKMRQKQPIVAVDVANSPATLLAAVLFIIPGFFSDLVGLICLLPPARNLLVRLLNKRSAPPGSTNSSSLGQGQTFEGRFRREDKS